MALFTPTVDRLIGCDVGLRPDETGIELDRIVSPKERRAVPPHPVSQGLVIHCRPLAAMVHTDTITMGLQHVGVATLVPDQEFLGLHAAARIDVVAPFGNTYTEPVKQLRFPTPVRKNIHEPGSSADH